ncbi:antibiotic biosynthesis monooxygenase [Ilyonectria destructans]|nr:antibiotic biosynthesis monooxygenase [Ilyonectria destructans]
MPPPLTLLDIPGTSTPFLSQLETETSSAVFINTFVLKSHKDEEQFLATWARDGNHMKSQYGMLSGQLHRSVGTEGNVFVNIAVWESTKAFRKAFADPEFKKYASHYPEGTIAYPIILSKMAVAGVCVA